MIKNKKYKIAILGNMNNSMLPVLEILQKNKCKSKLFCFRNEPNHFKPEKDTKNKKILKACTRFSQKYDPSNPDFILPTNQKRQTQLKKHLKSYNFLIGSGQAPAVISCIGRKLDIFAPYGSDLYQLVDTPRLSLFLKILAPLLRKSATFFDKFFSLFNRFLNDYMHYNLSWHQNKGIRESKKVIIAGTPKEFIPKKLQAIINQKRLPVPIPLVGYFHFHKNIKKKQFYSGGLKKIYLVRKKRKFLIFHHTRQFWKTEGDRWSNKRNEILFHGFQIFLQKNPDQKKESCLICFDYGPDVQNSKKLCRDLKIEKNVHWIKRMDRKDLMKGVALADLGVVEFGTTWMTGGVLFEFLASGIPVMQKYERSEVSDDGLKKMPVIAASTAMQVCNKLNRYSKQKARLKDLGKKGKAWYKKEVCKKFEKILLKELKNKNI